MDISLYRYMCKYLYVRVHTERGKNIFFSKLHAVFIFGKHLYDQDFFHANMILHTK